jgi:hypothetical protein
MSEQRIIPNQIIRDVATLDLRTTSEATFANIKQIENVATLLYSPQTAAHLARLNLANVATTIEAPAGAIVMSGQTTLGPNNFQHQQTPLAWIVSGQLFVDAALSAEALERGLESLVVSGQVLCPEHLAGVLQSKLKNMSGQFLAYPSDARIVLGKVVLTEAYLRELPDGAKLLIMGKLLATQPLPPELLAQKLGQLQLYGKVICAEENSGLVRAMQNQPVFGDVVIIPSGLELIDRPLMLDTGLLETLSGRKLYCTGMVHFGEDATADAVDQAIDTLVASRVLIAPSHLRKVLAQKCDLLNTKAIFYTGTLWLIEGEATLDQSRFEAVEGQVTLVVLGILQIDPTIEPGTLDARLQRVHNLGEIGATPAQLATLQARVGLNEGEWTDSSRPKNDENVTIIGDIAYLQL